MGQEPGTTRAAGVGRSGRVGRRLLRAFQLSGSDRNSDPACGVCATHVSPSAEALQPAHAHSDPGTPYTFYPYHQHPPRPQPASATPHAVAPPDDDQARRSSAGAAAETNHHQPLPPPPPTAIDGAATSMAGQYAYERDRL